MRHALLIVSNLMQQTGQPRLLDNRFMANHWMQQQLLETNRSLLAHLNCSIPCLQLNNNVKIDAYMLAYSELFDTTLEQLLVENEGSQHDIETSRQRRLANVDLVVFEALQNEMNQVVAIDNVLSLTCRSAVHFFVVVLVVHWLVLHNRQSTLQVQLVLVLVDLNWNN